MKKDRIFVLVMAVVVANLAINAGLTAGSIVAEPTAYGLWLRLVAQAVALIGSLWLLRSYRRARRIAKEHEQAEEG